MNLLVDRWFAKHLGRASRQEHLRPDPWFTQVRALCRARGVTTSDREMTFYRRKRFTAQDAAIAIQSFR